MDAVKGGCAEGAAAAAGDDRTVRADPVAHDDVLTAVAVEVRDGDVGRRRSHAVLHRLFEPSRSGVQQHRHQEFLVKLSTTVTGYILPCGRGRYRESVWVAATFRRSSTSTATVEKTRAASVTELRHTIKISITEGSFAQAFGTLAGPGSIFLTKFAVLLGATPFQFSILAATGQLSQVFQLFGTALTSRLTSRKATTIRLATLGRLLPLCFGALPMVIAPEHGIWLFLVLFFLSTALLALAGNLWIAWISDMIPLRLRGRFFSARSQYLMIAGLATGYAISAIIDLFDANAGRFAQAIRGVLDRPDVFTMHHQPVVFLFIFALATLLGLASSVILLRQPERPKPVEHGSFRETVTLPLRDPNFRRLLTYGIWWMLAVGVAAPFWGPFMITKLKMSLIQIQFYGALSTLAALVSLKPWGRLIDRYGNKTAMRLSLVLGGMNPMIWVFASPDRYWMVFAEAVTSGIMWAGAGIVGVNFVLAIAPKDRSQIYSGVYGAATGLAMMVTMLISGALLPEANPIPYLRLEPEQLLFALAGLSRWSAHIPLSWISEPRARPLPSLATYFRSAAALLRAQGKQWFHRNHD